METQGEDPSSGRSGRWTKQEHEQFLQGLREYGKDWKRIGALITTRTVVQVRTHAQKYFLATKKQEADPSSGTGSSKVPCKSNKRKRHNLETKGDESSQDPLDDLQCFNVLDTWSSDSDHSDSPTSADDVSLLHAPLPPHDDMSNSTGSTGSNMDLLMLDLSSQPPQAQHDAMRDSKMNKPQVSSPIVAPVTGKSPIHYPGEIPSTVEGMNELQELSNGFDPLPPSLESMILGKWMDTMCEY